ncbi:Phosphoglycolate phosphatase [Beijerinckiaceae bacterium RH AL1]|nr:HAD hydrolase-like protein [Beijerinckiaceae bacterium]VVB43887.1 Phosphoglycolate phosphatase [Beijerinckiaceae bacterium RH CH11]VVB43914.1 Phosphoglycolate phosphatase [Beijerinckiaceae bacterium RH AL8]VVC54063.1 Phosphoglycolate phosphatase [Beijerinckiaceae bacterium RH AL1]
MLSSDRSLPAAAAAARYDLVILDFDGTLADSITWFAGVFNEVARRYRFHQATPAELEALRGEGVAGILRALGVARWKVPLIARHMRKLVARDIAKIALFPGALQLIHDLAEAGLRLAMVSSNAEANVARLLGPEATALIDHFACGASLHGKVAKFRAVLDAAAVAPARAIAIGDEVRDVEAAAAAGIASGAVDWGYATRAALEARRPTVLFHEMSAITPFVLGLTA